jgi:hypothetical protein
MFVFSGLGVTVGFLLGTEYAWWRVRRDIHRNFLARKVLGYTDPRRPW